MTPRRSEGPAGQRVPSGALLLACVVGVVLSQTHVVTARSGEDQPLFRVIFSSAILGGVNHDDARASLQVWGTTLAQTRDRGMQVSAEIVADVTVVRDRLRAGTVDFYSVRVDEFFDIERGLPKTMSPGILYLGMRDGVPTERYVLIAHRASGLSSLAGLRGRSLVAIEGARRGLAPVWLDTALLEAGLPPAVQYFSAVVPADKVAKVVLPVFFHQRDVGLVTENGLATVAEMNPQVGRDIVVIARSEPVVGTVSALRSDYGPPSLRENVLAAIGNTSSNARGQQILALFGVEDITRASFGELDSARALLDKYARLTAKAPARRVP